MLEPTYFGLGQRVVDKFDGNGVYAGVQITGVGTPQGWFAMEGVGAGEAVDASAGVTKGDVYVTDEGHGVVDRFSEAGVFLCQITASTPGSVEAEEHECAGNVGSATPDGSMAPAGVTVQASTGDVFV